MKYNTKSITNILGEVFTGKYGGVEIMFEPGEKRYLPDMVAEHIAIQFLKRVEEMAKVKNEDIDIEETKRQVLGEEIQTSDNFINLSLKEEIENHQTEFTKWLEDKKKEDLMKINKAEEIIKNDSTEQI
jgi:hypothetical protein